VKSRAILQCVTSPHEAAKAAKKLLGQWPHAKPPNPEIYASGITATLTKYPLGIVEECCEFASPYVLSREFPPTTASIAEWCDKRLREHQTMAKYNSLWDTRPWEPKPEPDFSEEHCAMMRERIAAIPKVYFQRMPGSKEADACTI